MKRYVDATLNSDSLRISANLDEDHIVRQITESGQVYELELLELLQRIKPYLRGDTALDVGAHIGNHTAALGKVLGYRVIAVEPDRELFDELKTTITLNGLEDRVSAHMAAAWGDESVTILDYVAGSPTNRGMGHVVDAHSAEDAVQVPVVRLDEIVPDQARVALIKVDTEGSEAQVLRGATRILLEHRPVVIAEAHDHAAAGRLEEQLEGYVLMGVLGITPACIFAPEELSAELSAIVSGRSLLQHSLVQQRLDTWRGRASSSLDRIEGDRRRLGEMEVEFGSAVDRSNAQLSEQLTEVAQRIEAAFETLRETLERVSAIETRVSAVAAVEERLHRLPAIEEQLRGLPNIREQLRVLPAIEERLQGWERGQAQRVTEEKRRLEAAALQDLRLIRQLDAATSLRFARLVREAQAKGLRGWLRLPRTILAARRNGGLGTEYARYGGAAALFVERQPGQTTAPGTEATQGEAESRRPSARKEARQHLVSVIITAFNMEEHLADAVESIARQSYRNLEILVIDDASTDGTPERLAELARDEPRLRYIRMLENRGTYFCKNVGMVECLGDFITFNDADDRSDVQRIERQLSALQAGSGATLAACDYQRLDRLGRVVRNRGLQSRLSLQSLLFSKQVTAELGYFDSVRMSADAEFFARFCRRYGRRAYVHVREPLYFALSREGALTTTGGQEASLGDGGIADARRPVTDFLSEDRARYQQAFETWHRESKRPRVEFPPRGRPFPAPAKHLERTLSPAPVIAGMATIGARRSSLPLVIESLVDQVDELHVHMNDYTSPPTSDYDGQVRYTTFRQFGDMGDNAKFLPALQRTGPAYLFTVDDDILYPVDYVCRLQTAIDRFNREAAFGVHGIRLPSRIERFYKGRNVAHFKRECEWVYAADLIGSGTLAWHSDALRLGPDALGVPGMADLWFGIACRQTQVPRLVINRGRGWLRELPQESSIWSEARKDDAVQTEVATLSGPWGAELLERELVEWRPDLRSPSRRLALGFDPDRLAMPDRTW